MFFADEKCQLISRSGASIIEEARVDVPVREDEEVEEEREETNSVQRENCRDTVGTPRLGDPQTAGHSIPQKPSIRHQ